MQDKYKECLELLAERSITVEDIADCVAFLHDRYNDTINKEEYIVVTEKVLRDTGIQNALIIAIELDMLAESDGLRSKSIKEAMMADAGLFGVDELIGLGMTLNYGPIATTSFGYIDKVKPLKIGELNNSKAGVCNTFIDDVVGAIAACASSLLAHGKDNWYIK